MKSSPLWQSLADSASALRCAAADLSAANGSMQPVRLDLLARLGGVEADRLRSGGVKARLGGLGGGRHREPQDRGEGYDRGATDEGERGHDFDQSLYPNGAFMFAEAAECSVNGQAWPIVSATSLLPAGWERGQTQSDVPARQG